jgi:ABC-type sugar transport system ATPase subunit
MIAGLESISAGGLSIGGRRVNETPAKDRDIAVGFQNYALCPRMTAYAYDGLSEHASPH